MKILISWSKSIFQASVWISAILSFLVSFLLQFWCHAELGIFEMGRYKAATPTCFRESLLMLCVPLTYSKSGDTSCFAMASVPSQELTWRQTFFFELNLFLTKLHCCHAVWFRCEMCCPEDTSWHRWHMWYSPPAGGSVCTHSYLFAFQLEGAFSTHISANFNRSQSHHTPGSSGNMTY